MGWLNKGTWSNDSGRMGWSNKGTCQTITAGGIGWPNKGTCQTITAGRMGWQEHDDIASTHPDVIAALTDVLSAAAKKAFEPSRGAPQQAACDAARGKYKGHYGPFV